MLFLDHFKCIYRAKSEEKETNQLFVVVKNSCLLAGSSVRFFPKSVRYFHGIKLFWKDKIRREFQVDKISFPENIYIYLKKKLKSWCMGTKIDLLTWFTFKVTKSIELKNQCLVNPNQNFKRKLIFHMKYQSINRTTCFKALCCFEKM